jgi:hypothetical protein
MQFSSVLPLDGKACMSPVRRGSGGYGSERMRINCCSIRRNKALRRMCFSARGAVSSTQCVLTSDAGPDTLVSLILSIIVLVFHHSPLYFFIWLDVSCYNYQFLDAKTYRSSEHPFGGIMLILTKSLPSFWDSAFPSHKHKGHPCCKMAHFDFIGFMLQEVPI